MRAWRAITITTNVETNPLQQAFSPTKAYIYFFGVRYDSKQS